MNTRIVSSYRKYVSKERKRKSTKRDIIKDIKNKKELVLTFPHKSDEIY